jgi:hypothetical protein
MTEDPSYKVAMDVFKVLLPKSEEDATVILTGVAMVLATLSVEMGIPEEKATYAFTRSYRNAERRLKKLQQTSVH